MNKFQKSILAGVAVIGMGGASFMAHAVDNPTSQTANGGHQWNHEGRSPEKMRERMAKHQAKLHDLLKLTPAQEGAWKTFTASMTPPAQGKRPDHAEWAKLSAPARADKMLAMTKEREVHMAAHIAAMKTFYAALTPEQQKVFDANSMHGGRHHGGEHGEHKG
jgi:protein CpxP